MKLKIAFLSLPLLFLLLTNQWKSFSEGNAFLQTYDVTAGYEVIAKWAPALSPEPVHFHYAQRMAGAFLVGTAANLTGLPYQFWFFALSFILILSSCGLLLFASKAYASGTSLLSLIFPLLFYLWNPYAVRYYLLAPGMICDLLFVFGLTGTFMSLLMKKGKLLIVFLFVAAAGRQTVITVLPSVILWLYLSPGWRIFSLKKRIILSVASVAITGLYLFLISKVALRYSLPPNMGFYLTGVFQWIQANGFQWKVLLETNLRILLPLLPMTALLFAIGNWRKWGIENYLLILATLGIVSQPILTGPDTGANGGRLGALALIPMVFLVIGLLRQPFVNISRMQFIFGIVLLALLSLHHMYSVPGLGSATIFLALQLACCAAIFLTMYKSGEKRKLP